MTEWTPDKKLGDYITLVDAWGKQVPTDDSPVKEIKCLKCDNIVFRHRDNHHSVCNDCHLKKQKLWQAKHVLCHACRKIIRFYRGIRYHKKCYPQTRSGH